MGTSNLVLSIAVLLFANVVSAATLSVEVTQPSVLPGYKAYGIFWDGEGVEDWTSAALRVDLSSGTVYQEPTFGADTAPITIFITIEPKLEFDTYVGIIDDPTIALPLIGAGDLGGGPLNLNGPHISVAWGNTRITDTGLVKIGNFTVSNDAQGTWAILANNGSPINGIIIPEPMSLALLGLGVTALLHRH